MNILIIVLIFVIITLGIWVWVLKNRKNKVQCEVGGEINKQVQQKNIRKEEILKYLKEKGRVTNDEVQELVGVSDLPY